MGELFSNPYREKLIKEITREFDSYIFEQFWRHGYSRDDVIAAGIDGKITASNYGNWTRYEIDGKGLFSIKRETTGFETGSGMTFKFEETLYCVDIVDPKGMKGA